MTLRPTKSMVMGVARDLVVVEVDEISSGGGTRCVGGDATVCILCGGGLQRQRRRLCADRRG